MLPGRVAQPTPGVSTFDDKFFRNLLVQLCIHPADALENDVLEIKGWCRDERQLTEKLGDATSCLANAQGGVVLVGIGEESNAQKFSHCPFPNITPSWLVARVHDGTSPPVGCRAIDLTDLLQEVRGTTGSNAFAVIVERKKCLSGHVAGKGISRVRVGKECKPIFVTEEDRTNVVVPDATLEHLALGSIEFAMTHHGRHFQTVESFADPRDFLARTALLCPPEDRANDGVTLAALLLFGKEAAIRRWMPCSETVVQLHGRHITLRRNVVESLRELILAEHSTLRAACPTIPEPTLRELLVNAYVHRCWRTNGPVVITVNDSELDIQNPGDLLPGLHVDTLLYAVPLYRNFLLAEGLRFSGLSDKIGQGIDIVFKSVLSGGFDFPCFESANNAFKASITLSRSDNFRDFVRRRGASLSQLDELVVLRYLWGIGDAAFDQLCHILQRGREIGRRVLRDMESKLMIEVVDSLYRLTPGVRLDIEIAPNEDQLSLDLFGGT